MVSKNKLDELQRDVLLQCTKNNGYDWIKGFAGSGKTILLVHLIQNILIEKPNAKVCVVVFTHALKDLIQSGFEQKFKSKIAVMTYHQFLYKKQHYEFLVIDEIQDIPIDKLQQMISDLKLASKVKLLVTPSDQTKNHILEKSDIFILPSEWEAFGISILEAMAKNNAIISTRTEGGKYLIKDRENGYLYDYGDHSEITSRIKKLVKNPDQLEKIQQNNLNKAKKYTWNRIAKEYQDILTQLTR